MSVLSSTDRTITHRQEIIQMLGLAQDQGWEFAYLCMCKNHVSSHPIKMMSINPEAATFAIDCDIPKVHEGRAESPMFRMFSGGMSIIFRARPTGETFKVNGSRRLKAHVLELPYEMRCTQLRRATRIKLKQDAEVPVLLYADNSSRIRGSVVDISISGAKFRFQQDLRSDYGEFSFIETCKIRLPNNTVMRVTANVMGLVYDPEKDVTLMRCQFSRIKRRDELELEQLIESRLAQAETENEELAEAV